MKRTGRIREWGIFGSMAASLLLGLAAPILSLPAFWFLFRAGSWWIPLFFTYLVLILAPIGYYLERKIRIQQHGVMGSEAFYRAYPDERRRALLMRRKADVPEKVRQTIEACEAKPLPPLGEPEPAFMRRKIVGLTLFYTAGVLMLAIAAYLGYILYSEWQTPPRSDISGPVTLLAAVFCLVTGVLALFRKKLPLLGYIAAGLLFVSAWSRLVLILTKNYTPLTSHFVELLISLAVYALAAFVLLCFAVDLKSPAHRQEAERTIILELYELGVLNESELKYRLEK